MKLRIYSDGGARGNPGPAAIGVLICDERNKVLFRYFDTIGETTNNVAEYCALIAGLELARRFGADELECFMDSELLMNQMVGRFKVKAPHIRDLHARAKKTAQLFNAIMYRQKSRETPMLQEADRLVNEALDGKSLLSEDE